MRRTRVVHVTFDMRIGGAERVICNLVRHTDRSSYDVSLLCLDGLLGPFGRQLQEEGCRVTTLERRPGFDFSLVEKIRGYIVRQRIDVLHCHQYTPYFYGVLGAAMTGAKVIFTEHGRFHPDERKLKRVVLNPFLSMLTHRITAISAATREALVRFENFPGKKIRIVYNGISEIPFGTRDGGPLRESLGIPPGARVLGTVARLDPIKNQRMMVKGLKIVQQTYPGTYLVIVGGGPERRNLEDLVSRLQLSSSVIFTGFREDVPRFYEIMDVFLLTSFSEGTAMTLLEAMAAALPCIVTNVGGNVEIVEAGETGFIVPNDDEATLARKICTLFADSALRKRMGMSGRKRFEDHFTVDRMVLSYQALYDGAD